MTKLQGFLKFVEKNSPVIERVTPEFPYQNSEEKAYIVTLKGVTQYLFFNSEGGLLVQKRIK